MFKFDLESGSKGDWFRFFESKVEDGKIIYLEPEADAGRVCVRVADAETLEKIQAETRTKKAEFVKDKDIDHSLMYGSVVVANIKEWSMSGFTQGTTETTAFGTTIKTFVAADAGDPGTITFSGNYDPADINGQKALDAVCVAGTELTNLYLYTAPSTFWRVGANGKIIDRFVFLEIET